MRDADRDLDEENPQEQNEYRKDFADLIGQHQSSIPLQVRGIHFFLREASSIKYSHMPKYDYFKEILMYDYLGPVVTKKNQDIADRIFD